MGVECREGAWEETGPAVRRLLHPSKVLVDRGALAGSSGPELSFPSSPTENLNWDGGFGRSQIGLLAIGEATLP